MADWDPELYDRFRRYRAEPAQAMVARLELENGERVIDLGCGSGHNTVELARRAAAGHVLGLDSSPAMIDQANRLRAGLEPAVQARLSFTLGDISAFRSDRAYSLIFSNAALQWVSDHRALFDALFQALSPRGRLAIQMPANEHETAKRELDRLAREEPWQAKLGGFTAPFAVPPPATYQAMLLKAGFVAVECYYHTFEHPMNSPVEVVEWYRATGLRPFLARLGPDDEPVFLAQYRTRLERAYATKGPMVFTFRRLFLFASRPAA